MNCQQVLQKNKKSAYNLDFYVKNEVVFILIKLYYGSRSLLLKFGSKVISGNSFLKNFKLFYGF
jgi:hypothetical protein